MLAYDIICKASDVICQLLGTRKLKPQKAIGKAYAPSNIALVKYWGKRNQQLHLPYNSSLSVSLQNKGAKTSIIISENDYHSCSLNGEFVSCNSDFMTKLSSYLDLYKDSLPYYFHIETHSNVPIGAGVASSACGYAALVLALDDLFNFNLSKKKLSILARLGSGSAARSLWQGFVCWHKGTRDDGFDSFGEPFNATWPELRIGLWYVSQQQKSISSRDAMQQTVETSPLYKDWPARAETDFFQIQQHIQQKNLNALGLLAENNALAMHQSMQASVPTINYWLPESKTAMQQIQALRQQGIPVFFTMDAGPNLKIITETKYINIIEQSINTIEWI